MTRRLVLAGGVVAAMLGAAPANADAIDGNWCTADGRHMSIQGRQVVTPAGTAIAVDYGRHAFNYTVPAAEPDGGAEMALRLIHDNEMRSALVSGGPTEVWRRCEFTS